jgi:hypothetical protein
VDGCPKLDQFEDAALQFWWKRPSNGGGGILHCVQHTEHLLAGQLGDYTTIGRIEELMP